MADRRVPEDVQRAEDGSDEAPEHAEINPAARRDSPETPTERQEDHQPGDNPAPAEQGEPLDPLGPGGIGA